MLLCSSKNTISSRKRCSSHDSLSSACVRVSIAMLALCCAFQHDEMTMYIVSICRVTLSLWQPSLPELLLPPAEEWVSKEKLVQSYPHQSPLPSHGGYPLPRPTPTDSVGIPIPFITHHSFHKTLLSPLLLFLPSLPLLPSQGMLVQLLQVAREGLKRRQKH